ERSGGPGRPAGAPPRRPVGRSGRRAGLRPASRARAARRLARHAGRHPADDRVHRRQLPGRIAHRRLGGAGRGAAGVPPPAGAPRERAAGRQRAVRGGHRRRHRRLHRPAPRLLRPRHHPQRRSGRRPVRVDRAAPAAGRRDRGVPGAQSPRFDGRPPAPGPRHARPHGPRQGRAPPRRARSRDRPCRARPRSRAALARGPAAAAGLQLADRALGLGVPRAGRRPVVPVPRQREQRRDRPRGRDPAARPAGHRGRGPGDPVGRVAAAPAPRARPRFARGL
ncbi:MAG: PROBABLE CONSERVED INTEGRAL MEMBRANE ALANINE AND LEUCINE RICH PROTEIN, partial [uncultured Blastococcus sp.]